MSTFDNYEEYEEKFNPLRYDRQARRKRKPKVHHEAKKSNSQILAESVDATEGLEGGFKPTYVPGLFEEGWLLDSLRGFYDSGVLLDILGRVKGGKEANVYRCKGKLNGETTLIAAKVYRPRMFRNLRNDKIYREGRTLLKPPGSSTKQRDERILRAVKNKSDFGQEVEHMSWLMHEHKTLKTLFAAGGAVPQAIGVNDNTILMTYLGNEKIGAPALNEVSLDTDEALPLFDEIIRNIDLMLAHSMIHGDLSAYNVLYWEGKITLIDFPQVTNRHTNTRAYFILRRDIQRICEYFAQQGIERDFAQLTDKLWRLHGGQKPSDMVREALENMQQE